MLHKNLAQSLKDVDAARGIVCGYASSFNVVDDGNDMVLPGAFTKTITEQGPGSRQPRIKWLYQHDSTQILGVPQVLKEDGFGLYFEAKIANTTLGRDVLALYEAGVITEHSIGYETVEAEWDRTHQVRLLKSLRLFEWSSVTWGMNSETPTVAVKSASDPSHLSALATKAARLDTLLHNGTLRSDALCETLERELKALQIALAPTAEAARQPYTIQGVLTAMDELTSRFGTKAAKAATDDDKAAQEARAKKYGIGIKDGGAVTKPSEWDNLTDADFGDPVNYRYPMPDKAHADDAAARFTAATARADYTAKEQDIVAKRIMKKQTSYGEEPDWWPIKDAGGKSSANGQERRIRKARDFDTLFASLNAADDLQDEWGDTFIAFVRAMEELMWQVQAQTNGWLPDSAQQIDPSEAAQANLDAFSTAVLSLVTRSAAAAFAPCLDDDGDQFLDPDGCNADDDDDDDWKSARTQRTPLAMPDAPALVRKAGRAISGANRETITNALDGMTKAMSDMQVHHKSIVDLMTKTDPDAVRQDEANTQGDDDSENGGTNINKSSRLPIDSTTPRRTADAGHTPQAGNTHIQGNTSLDVSAVVADLDALKSRLTMAGRTK